LLIGRPGDQWTIGGHNPPPDITPLGQTQNPMSLTLAYSYEGDSDLGGFVLGEVLSDIINDREGFDLGVYVRGFMYGHRTGHGNAQ